MIGEFSIVVLDSTQEKYIVGRHKFDIDETSGVWVHLIEMTEISTNKSQWVPQWMLFEMIKDRNITKV